MQLLTIKELSQLLKVKQSTLYAWASRGMIPSFKLNGLLRFDHEEIGEWIKSSRNLTKSFKVFKSKQIKDEDIDRAVRSAIASVKKLDYNRINGKPSQSGPERR